MDYNTLRHLADSWGLLAMLAIFLSLCAWPFRPGARTRNNDAAKLIFKDDNDG
ncbi:CcoQ/FixQ family Cbb3-type cytochrome c oxidase assembly chaperone [Altererythrobacter confluentis]|uniref:CcoQ/FixQ family Cbb3-type cytochrome c oxidase assembly chaperone n=1 Tax=Allopontixanthobacter confluentis TaxID=1849021 RepID=A0A6L7GLX4_9SPHN|nr:cbb3-type cytochrome c oxidase subunit 3 [Allopontixanthobacter confluentis]MXP15651.1 CcoQ/FixQ family Cbb3-type cytochrome c oxidase assembly chaperone [Allopontixanthobacter confluentis]